jgi:hypothetical protein
VKTLGKTKLQIKNQSAFLTQIASVYQSFLRAAMEYVDNAVDATATLRQADPGFVGRVRIDIDTSDRRVIFEDNCGGMSPATLIGLLGDIGNSKKRGQSFTNGQFGFGVHSFRGFARYARFRSRSGNGPTAEILIDRDLGEDAEIPCNDVSSLRPLSYLGTEVSISGFDGGVFKKGVLFEGIISEIRQHFDDVLRSGIIQIEVSVDGASTVAISHFDYASLPGEAIHEELALPSGGSISADIKVLDKIAEQRPPLLTIKGRRIQEIAELRSFRAFARSAGRSTSIWNNPLVVGGVEVAGALHPTITRDDVKPGEARDEAYGALLALQLKIEDLVRERLDQKRQQAYDDLAKKISDCLAQVLKNYKLRFDSDSGADAGDGKGKQAGGTEPFGGEKPGGGGPGGDGVGGDGNKKGTDGETGPGTGETGGGDSGPGKAENAGAGNGAAVSAAPEIRFSDHPEYDQRVIAFGRILEVNTAHPDFISRRTATAKVGPRLVSYVAQVVAGPCVGFLYAKRGKPLAAANVAEQVTDVAVQLEGMLTETGVVDELLAKA